MKKITFSLIFVSALLLTISGILFFGCDKEEELVEEGNNAIENADYKLPEILKTGITFEEDVAVFTDYESFNRITDLLEEENYQWNLAFYEKWKHLGEDGVNEKAEELNFNHFYTYEVFEKYHGIKTMRSIMKEAEDKWLENEELDWDNDPTIHAISLKSRAIANSYGEYMVGNSIYHIEKEGIYYEITNGDFDLLKDIRNKQIDYNKSYDNIVIHNLEIYKTYNKSECRAWATENDYAEYDCQKI